MRLRGKGGSLICVAMSVVAKELGWPMETFQNVALRNAVVAAGLALVLLPAARLLRRPALTLALCLLILVKLVTPPVWRLPVEWPAAAAASETLGTQSVSATASPQWVTPVAPSPIGWNAPAADGLAAAADMPMPINPARMEQ